MSIDEPVITISKQTAEKALKIFFSLVSTWTFDVYCNFMAACQSIIKLRLPTITMITLNARSEKINDISDIIVNLVKSTFKIKN